MFFPLGSPAPTRASSVCLSELRTPASLPVPCGTAPPRGRPGQGLGLPCLDTSRNSGPSLAGPSNNGPSVPSSGPAPTGRPPAPSPAPHTSAVPPQAPVPTPGAGILPPEGRAWESHAARSGNWFCRIPRAVLPGWEPGGFQGQEPGQLPCTGWDISVPATTLKPRGSWPHFTARESEAEGNFPGEGHWEL